MIGIDVHPIIKDLILVITETCFFLYKIDTKTPIFYSPYLSGHRITFGKFSTSWANVIYLGKENGVLDIWDF